MYDNVRPRRFGAGNPTRKLCPDCNKLIPVADFSWHREQIHPPPSQSAKK